MEPNKPDGEGWWYKASLDVQGLPFHWVIVRLFHSKDERLMWKGAAGPYYVDDLDDNRNTYWERVLPPWERKEQPIATDGNP